MFEESGIKLMNLFTIFLKFVVVYILNGATI